MVHILDHLYYGITLITIYLKGITLSDLRNQYIVCLPYTQTNETKRNETKRYSIKGSRNLYIFITTL
jgi:hypothetical protein